MSSVRVRFAPSPTGYLHIGGARTALYNYLFAKKVGGTFVLRVEDTDLERSKKEYEELQISDLRWLGIIHDEGPDKPNPKYAPYRQTERLDIYRKYAQELVEKDLAYYDFCTDEELDEMKKKAEAEGRDPHYEGKWKEPQHRQEALRRVQAGEKAAIRFRVPKKSYTLKDLVKGEVTYPEGMVGDFIILRSNGMAVYNYCVVIDDILMDISHVIRGEDHLSNTVRQLMIYEAHGAQLPIFAHVSLLIGDDRQKLSKRHGATSVNLYREQHYLPEAMNNYLCLLGWSHPAETDIFTKEEVTPVFDITRFSPHSAIYDLVKFKWVNAQHLKKQLADDLIKELMTITPKGHHFTQQTQEWKTTCVELLKNYAHFVTEFIPLMDTMIFNELIDHNEKTTEILSWETTPKIIQFVKERLNQVSSSFIAGDELNSWQEQIKKEFNVKGKPLFMGFRLALTGHDHGPDLKILIPLTPVAVLKKRVSQWK